MTMHRDTGHSLMLVQNTWFSLMLDTKTVDSLKLGREICI